MQHSRGFTLIELLVVVGIIGLLSTTILASLGTARANARDAARQNDLKQMHTALELYFTDHERYPEVDGWTGYQTTGCGLTGDLSGPDGFIPDLAPEYMQQLPIDPQKLFGGCRGYLYYSNGTHFKLLSNEAPDSYPSPHEGFYDPVRPTWAMMVCSGEPACSTW